MSRKRRAILMLALPVIVLALPVIVIVASVTYKAASGFYSYKGYICTHVLPRVYGSPALQALTFHDASENLTVIEGIPIPTTLSPESFTNKRGAIGVRITIHDGTVVEAYHHLQDLKDVRGWFASTDEGTSTEVLRRYYGSWENVRDRFPTDLDLLTGVFDFTLPSYLRQGSASMSPPLGYYLLPLFPPLKSYRSDIALNTVMALHIHQSRTWYRSVGSSAYFFVSQTDKATELLYGVVDGNIRGAIILRDLNGPVDLSVIKMLCSCIDTAYTAEEME